MSDPMRPPASHPRPHTAVSRSEPSRSRAALRTAVVWDVLQDALD
ncbi:SAM-dependent methyltransferase, partial [Streptomyces violaceoruber]